MSFFVEHLHLVHPLPALVEAANALPEQDLAELVLEPVVLTKKYSTHAEVGAAGHAHRLTVKLAHLARIREYFDHDPDLFARVFGGPELTEALFDRWWSLTEIDEIPIERMRDWISDYRSLIPPTGIPTVDRWLDGEKPDPL